jgi:hypothetical protein
MGIAEVEPRQLAPTMETTGSGSTDSPAPSPTIIDSHASTVSIKSSASPRVIGSSPATAVDSASPTIDIDSALPTIVNIASPTIDIDTASPTIDIDTASPTILDIASPTIDIDTASPTTIDTALLIINVDTDSPTIVDTALPSVGTLYSPTIVDCAPMIAIDTPVAAIDDPISCSTGPISTRIGGFKMTFGLFNFHVDDDGAAELISIIDPATPTADLVTQLTVENIPSITPPPMLAKVDPMLESSTPSVRSNNFQDLPPSPTIAYCVECDAYHFVGDRDFSLHEIAGCEDPHGGTAAVYPTISKCERALNALMLQPAPYDPEGFRSIVNQKISYGCEQESQDLI